MRTVRTNIVIITYNALPYTRVTLESLFEKTHTPYNLTIVDNGSDIDTVNYINNIVVPDSCKKITVILNKSNEGVGHAYNQGQQVSFADGVEFTAFCNNDLYFSTNWLQYLENRMDQNPNIAMLSPLRPSAKVKYDDKKSTRDVLTELLETDDWRREIELYTKLTIGQFDEFSKRIVKANLDGELETIAFPDSLSTCVCLTRNRYFSILQRFADPIFTGYGGEDIDMSWTIMELGYDCAVDHGVYVHHFRGKSLKSNSINRTEMLKISNKKLYSKWKQSIHDHIADKLSEGVDIVSDIKYGHDSRYWLLHELNNDEHFVEDYIHA